MDFLVKQNNFVPLKKKLRFIKGGAVLLKKKTLIRIINLTKSDLCHVG